MEPQECLLLPVPLTLASVAERAEEAPTAATRALKKQEHNGGQDGWYALEHTT